MKPRLDRPPQGSLRRVRMLLDRASCVEGDRVECPACMEAELYLTVQEDGRVAVECAGGCPRYNIVGAIRCLADCTSGDPSHVDLVVPGDLAPEGGVA